MKKQNNILMILLALVAVVIALNSGSMFSTTGDLCYNQYILNSGFVFDGTTDLTQSGSGSLHDLSGIAVECTAGSWFLKVPDSVDKIELQSRIDSKYYKCTATVTGVKDSPNIADCTLELRLNRLTAPNGNYIVIHGIPGGEVWKNVCPGECTVTRNVKIFHETAITQPTIPEQPITEPIIEEQIETQPEISNEPITIENLPAVIAEETQKAVESVTNPKVGTDYTYYYIGGVLLLGILLVVMI